MKQNKKILIGIILVALLIVIYFVFINNKINKSSFVIKIRGDFTSSGAQRNYYASLAFIDNILVEGTESYYVGEGGGCKENCERSIGCKVNNQKWVDLIDGTDCKITYPFIPLMTKEGILNQIKEKKEQKFIPMNKCNHGNLCYEFIYS